MRCVGAPLHTARLPGASASPHASCPPPLLPAQSASAKKVASAGKKDKAAAPAVKKTAPTKKAAPAKKGPAKKAKKVRRQPWLGGVRGRAPVTTSRWCVQPERCCVFPAGCCARWQRLLRVRPSCPPLLSPYQLARLPASLVACAAAARCRPCRSRSRGCRYSRPWAYWRHRWRLLSGCGGAEAAPLHSCLTGLQCSRHGTAAKTPFDNAPPRAPVLPTSPLPPPTYSALRCQPPCMTTLANYPAARQTTLVSCFTDKPAALQADGPCQPSRYPTRQGTLPVVPPVANCTCPAAVALYFSPCFCWTLLLLLLTTSAPHLPPGT